MGFKLEKAGVLSAAPYGTMGVILIIAGYFADLCQIKGYLTTEQVRKYFNCGGFLAQIVFLMSAPFLNNPALTITFIVIAVGLGGFSWCGFS